MAAGRRRTALAAPSNSVTAEGAPVRGRSRAMRTWRAARTVALRTSSIAAMVLCWWLLTFFFPPTLIPHPVETLAEVAAIVGSGQFFAEMGATLRRVGVGFGLAMLVSIPLGILMGTVRSLESF